MPLWVWPSAYTRLSGYKYTSTHHALDIGTPLNSKVVAPTAGKVIWSGSDSSGYGTYVIIQSAVEGYKVYLAHLSQAKVKAGDKVSPGDLIGYAGSTGNSTGPHLHFEIRTSGGWINPYSLYGSNPTILPSASGSAPKGSIPSGSNKPGVTSPASTGWADNSSPGIVNVGASFGDFTTWLTQRGPDIGAIMLGGALLLLAVYGLVTGEGARTLGNVVAGAVAKIPDVNGGE